MSTDNQELKIGDVVELKSGGPMMTISEKDKNGNFFCLWFKAKDLLEGTFSPTSLTAEKK